MSSQMTASRSTPRSRPGWWRFRWVPLGVVAFLIGAFMVSQLNVASPRTIAKVTLENHSVYDVHITATGADRDGVTSVGIAPARSATEIDDVIDQGDVWIFHFDGQARDGGEIQITRRELADHGWKVVIPDAVAARLRAAGAAPSLGTGGG